MELKEWIERYNQKAPEPFKRNEMYEFYFDEEKGFCEIGMTDKMVVINQMSGDGRYWRDKVTDLARKIGYKMCGTWCVRSAVPAYIRLFGYKVWKKEKLKDGLTRYYGVNKEGKKGIMSPSFSYASGEVGYFVTWEV